ncbi:MAG: carboxypeptidase-like regulatory domain-containing protein [Acidobacteriota bacterium]
MTAQTRPAPAGDPLRLQPLDQGPGAFLRIPNAIVGYAQTSNGDRLAAVVLRLRNLYSGDIVAAGVSDEHGRFAFRNVPAATYIVEATGADEKVIAVSPVVTLASHEVGQVVVTLPDAIPLDGWLPSATSAVTATAASAGVTAIAPGVPVSPNR